MVGTLRTASLSAHCVQGWYAYVCTESTKHTRSRLPLLIGCQQEWFTSVRTGQGQDQTRPDQTGPDQPRPPQQDEQAHQGCVHRGGQAHRLRRLRRHPEELVRRRARRRGRPWRARPAALDRDRRQRYHGQRRPVHHRLRLPRPPRRPQGRPQGRGPWPHRQPPLRLRLPVHRHRLPGDRRRRCRGRPHRRRRVHVHGPLPGARHPLGQPSRRQPAHGGLALGVPQGPAHQLPHGHHRREPRGEVRHH
mmetsp:Transcript_3905/g.9765  ORF Transcript_3905/g.9765 Transcript_3905/m.9765 type:complete len:248 (+) Transcript_3905:1242-1985(+)